MNQNQHQVIRIPAKSKQFLFPLGVLVGGVLLYYLSRGKILMKLHCGVHSVTTLLTICILAFLLFDQTENAQNQTQIFKIKFRFFFCPNSEANDFKMFACAC